MRYRESVSIVIPAYNCQRFIRETLLCLLNQELTPLEIIVVDDGSTDETYEICQVLAQSNNIIKVYRNKENCGPAKTRNRGVEIASGEWVLFMDGDDLAEPALLEKELNRIDEYQRERAERIILVHSAYKQIDEDGLELPGIHRWQQVKSREILGYLFVRNPIISTSGVLVRREYFLRTGGFDPTLRHSEDWELWLRLAKLGGFAYLDEPLVKIRRHKSNTSGKVRLMLESERKVLRRYDFNIIKEAIMQRDLAWEKNMADLVSILYRLQNWEEGAVAAGQIIEQKPAYAMGYFLCGLYHLHKEQWHEAQGFFEECIRFDSRNGAALNNLGALYGMNGAREKAIRVLSKVLELYPGYLDAKTNFQEIMNKGGIEATEARFTWRELRPVLLSYTE